MIDTHVHILPNLDDGPRTIGESLAMADRSASNQVTCVVATPHSVWSDVEVSCELVEGAVEELQEALLDRGIKLRVLPGVEVHLSTLIAKLAANDDLRAHTPNGSRYLLIELPLGSYPHYVERVMFDLQVKGLVPVLAHPERCKIFQDDVDLLYRIVERGH